MIQSENPGLRSSLKAFDKENAHSNLPVSKAAMNVPVKHQLLQPASTRKALGNITNISNSSKQEVPSADKKNSVLLPPRRALGDITNSAAPSKKLPLPTPEIVKPKLNAVTTAEPRPSAKASATMLRAEQFALDDIERSAGKTWTQLESERHQEQENTINQRVKQLTTATLAALRTPMDVMVGVCIPGVSARIRPPTLPSPMQEGSSCRSAGGIKEGGDDMDLSPEAVVRPPLRMAGAPHFVTKSLMFSFIAYEGQFLGKVPLTALHPCHNPYPLPSI